MQDDDDQEDEDEAPPRASLLQSEGSEDEQMDQHHDSAPLARQRRALSNSVGRHSKRRYAGSSFSGSSSPERAPTRQQKQPPATKEQPWASKLKLEPKRVAVMQASFFQQKEKPSPVTQTETKKPPSANVGAEAFSVSLSRYLLLLSALAHG